MSFHSKKISKKFNEKFKFDYYDITFCLDNFLDGETKIGVTTNIRIAHNSVGQMREGWYTAREEVNKIYNDDYPIEVK